MNMRQFIFSLLLSCSVLLFTSELKSQVPVEKGNNMTYIINLKPNNILYGDTLYRGSKEFMPLFYRTRDVDLIELYHKHQQNKIAGQVLGVVGTVATLVGISKLTASNPNKTLGWSLIGGGFASTLTGGFLIMEGQKKLAMAVTLFNQRHQQAALGVGVGQQQLGLVYKF